MKKIGIDPDNKFIGCAILEDNKLTIDKYSIPEFFYKVIPSWKQEYDKLCEEHRFGDMVIYLEGGWLNKVYYHSTENLMIVNNIARKIGMNHQVGITIEECLKYLGLICKTVRPVQDSKFKNAKEKINHAQLEKMVNAYGVEYDCTRSNQDERDGALLLLHYVFENPIKTPDFTFL